MKPRTRLYFAGHATFRLVKAARGWCGPYGQTWSGAKWACIDCGRTITGDWEDDLPRYHAPQTACARNGHAPCRLCGAILPRLNDGCPREHSWRKCPYKAESDRMRPQHAHAGHLARPVAVAS